MSLLALVPLLSPWLSAPSHLRPIAEVIEQSLQMPKRLVISTPPQHGKTELILHGLTWLARHQPRLRHAYATFSDERTTEVSRRWFQIAEAGGLGPTGKTSLWAVEGGGSVRFTSVGGALTGSPVDGLLIVDDPVKNRVEAESHARRLEIREWFRDVVLTRRHPQTSVVVVMTRWHPEDLAGDLSRAGWPVINLPALAEADDPLGRELGAPLWPECRPLDFLMAQRADLGGENGMGWVSLYQGRPRPRGGTVFEGVRTYRELPAAGLRWAIGVDLAYSAKTHADYSVALDLAHDGSQGYIVDLVRRQLRAEEFAPILGARRVMRPTAAMRWYAAGAELGVAGLLETLHAVSQRERNEALVALHLEALPATSDKLVRAQAAAAAWNSGRLLVPETASWLDSFLAEVLGFTGVGDEHDDQVDALAAGWDALNVAPAACAVPSTHSDPLIEAGEWSAQYGLEA